MLNGCQHSRQTGVDTVGALAIKLWVGDALTDDFFGERFFNFKGDEIVGFFYCNCSYVLRRERREEGVDWTDKVGEKEEGKVRLRTYMETNPPRIRRGEIKICFFRKILERKSPPETTVQIVGA